MDNSTKGILIGLGAVTLIGAGIATALASSEEARTKTKAAVNRQRAKHIVNTKFDGNNKAKKVVSKLSDEEINRLLETADKASELEDQFKDAFAEVESFFKDKGKQVAKAIK